MRNLSSVFKSAIDSSGPQYSDVSYFYSHMFEFANEFDCDIKCNVRQCQTRFIHVYLYAQKLMKFMLEFKLNEFFFSFVRHCLLLLWYLGKIRNVFLDLNSCLVDNNILTLLGFTANAMTLDQVLPISPCWEVRLLGPNRSSFTLFFLNYFDM